MLDVWRRLLLFFALAAACNGYMIGDVVPVSKRVQLNEVRRGPPSMGTAATRRAAGVNDGARSLAIVYRSALRGSS